MADQHQAVLERRLEQERTALGQRVQALVLGLELQGPKSVLLPAAPHFGAELVLWDERIQASRPCEPVGVRAQRIPDFVVLATEILHYRERDE